MRNLNLKPKKPKGLPRKEYPRVSGRGKTINQRLKSS
jgi:hypothetical protein